MRSISACARAHTLKLGKSPFRFIGNAERIGPKPECISALIERQRVRLSRSDGSKCASGFISCKYSPMARVSQIFSPLCVRLGTRNDEDLFDRDLQPWSLGSLANSCNTA